MSLSWRLCLDLVSRVDKGLRHALLSRMFLHVYLTQASIRSAGPAILAGQHPVLQYGAHI